MLGGLFIASLIGTVIQAVKESCESTIPAENWANEELIHKDRMNNISDKQFYKNLANGKYRLTETYPAPHRDPKTGKIIIENSLLYKEDCRNYDPLQVSKWINQGKYNLTPEELKKEKERIQKELEYAYSLL